MYRRFVADDSTSEELLWRALALTVTSIQVFTSSLAKFHTEEVAKIMRGKGCMALRGFPMPLGGATAAIPPKILTRKIIQGYSFLIYAIHLLSFVQILQRCNQKTLPDSLHLQYLQAYSYHNNNYYRAMH